MSGERERALVGRLSAEFPLFAMTTIERWVRHELDVCDPRTDACLERAQASVRATLLDLSRASGTTADHLPVAPRLA